MPTVALKKTASGSKSAGTALRSQTQLGEQSSNARRAGPDRLRETSLIPLLEWGRAEVFDASSKTTALALQLLEAVEEGLPIGYRGWEPGLAHWPQPSVHPEI